MQKGGTEGYRIRGTKIVSPEPVELTPGEHRLLFALQRFFKPEMIFADYYLAKLSKSEKVEAGRVVTTSDLLQIDCLAVDERGVFVFESKDYVGWIYGHGERRYWTQVSGYGKNKYQFYNPVRQNIRHVEAIRAITGEEVPVYSVVVFGREATLKVVDGLPVDCFVCTQASLNKVLAAIKPKNRLPIQRMQKVRRDIMAGRVSATTGVRKQHAVEVESFVKVGEINETGF